MHIGSIAARGFGAALATIWLGAGIAGSAGSIDLKVEEPVSITETAQANGRIPQEDFTTLVKKGRIIQNPEVYRGTLQHTLFGYPVFSSRPVTLVKDNDRGRMLYGDLKQNGQVCSAFTNLWLYMDPDGNPVYYIFGDPKMLAPTHIG